MSYIASEINYFGLDAGGRTRVSQIYTLHDGKILNKDNEYIWDVTTIGTGTGTFSTNKYNMTVSTISDAVIRQTKRYMPYSSGKSQLIECTFDNFQIQTGTTKRVGYFSSINTTPFENTLDGIFLENDGTTYRLRTYRSGVSTLDLPWTSWDNYSQISSYDWSKFTVIAFDFLWLGGAVLRLFLKTSIGFVLCHTFNYSSTSSDTFILTPNQPVRYEIRSNIIGAVGSFRYICSQVATEGSIDESGYNVSVSSLSTAAIPSNTVATIGTVYPVKAVRKKSGFRDSPSKFIGVSLNVSSTNDIVLWSVQLNPTLSAGLTWVDTVPSNALEEANGSSVAAISTTVTTQGKVLASGICTPTNGVNTSLFQQDFLSYLGCSITDVMDTIVLCVQPITASITLNATMTIKEY